MAEQSLQNFIDDRRTDFVACCPKDINFDAEKKFAIQLLNNNQKLMEAAISDKRSLANAIDNVAAIGLSLNPAEKLAYLIPRNVKVKGDDGRDRWIGRIFLEPSYIGLCKLATDSGSIEWIQAVCVHENDEIVDNGPGLRPDHNYRPFPKKNRGEFTGCYCVAKTLNGDFLSQFMDVDEINEIRGRSESAKKNYGPWVTDYFEQAKKTVIRRASKTWPKTNVRFLNAVHLSNENEGFEPIINNPDVKSFSPDQKIYFDQLIEKGDGLGMYTFKQSFDVHDASSENASVWVSLMHSFEKGSKGKYQTIVNELIQKGFDIFNQYLSSFEQSIGIDDSVVIELASELESEQVKLIEARLNPEMVMDFKSLIGDCNEETTER